jgi:predicted aconitase with swiveling domain
MRERIVKCRGVVPGTGAGEALVSTEAFCFYLCDAKTGTVVEKNHELYQRSVAGKVMLIKSGKGSSVVMIDGLYQLKMNHNLPAAIIVQDIEPVLVSSAVVVGVPIVDRLAVDPYELIRENAHVMVDADKGEIRVFENPLQTEKGGGFRR